MAEVVEDLKLTFDSTPNAVVLVVGVHLDTQQQGDDGVANSGGGGALVLTHQGDGGSGGKSASLMSRLIG